MKYVTNTFSLNMLPLPERGDFTKYIIIIENLSISEFCEEISDKDIVNAIGHQSTVDVINYVCNTNLPVNRVEIKLNDNSNELLIFQILVRPKEGQIFNRDEIFQLWNNGKVMLLRVSIVRLK